MDYSFTVFLKKHFDSVLFNTYICMPDVYMDIQPREFLKCLVEKLSIASYKICLSIIFEHKIYLKLFCLL